MREIILDTETTGLDPAVGHRIVEIGAVEVVDGNRTGRVFHYYLNPERSMPKEAERVHGLGDEFLADKPLFKEIAKEMLEFFADSTLVINNAGFDLKFINAELAKIRKQPLSQKIVDTLEIARKKFPGAKANLDALCSRFGINRAHRDKHGALLDAELLADVYERLMGRETSLLALFMPAMKEGAQQQSTVNMEKIDFPLRQFSANADEKEAHKALLREFKVDPIWAKYS